MPLSPEIKPCNFCIDIEMYRIAEENGDDPNVSTVDLNQITKTFRYCCRCLSPFCADHASPVDQSDCCFHCLPFEDISEMKTPLISQDEMGTHVHKGYRLVPTGLGYKTLPKAISQMTDSELEAFINEKANQVHNIERQRDYLRVAQSTAKLEKSEREIAAHRALKGIKLPPGVLTPSSKGIKITGKANGAVKGVVAPAGLDLAAFLKFASDAISKKKPAQAPTSSPSVAAKPTSPTTPAATASRTTQQRAVTVKKEGGSVDGPAPPSTSLEDQAREAEIEAILNEEEEK